MQYCCKCGAKLKNKYLKNEGMIPFCEHCSEFRFPIYSTAVSMVVQNSNRDKILLIKQYGKPNFVLVAGYINKGEDAENAVKREVMEEIGINVSNIKYNKSKYFSPTNTLMLNFSCVADTEDLSHITDEVDFARWLSLQEAKENIMEKSLAKEFLLDFLKQKNGCF